MKLLVEVEEGMRAPKWYGPAYAKWEVPVYVYAVFPLNWFVRWGRKLYSFFLRRFKPTRVEKLTREARRLGYKEGYKRGYDKRRYEEDHFIRNLERKLDLRQKRRGG